MEGGDVSKCEISSVTCSAGVNIAIVKYWGKRCEDLNLPLNSSLSITLNQDHLRALTTSSASFNFDRDRVWVNEVEQDVDNNPRILACLKQIRRRSKLIENPPVHVRSGNNFPTAAGLASSAAGYAAMVSSLARLHLVDDATCDISAIARRGSGSAARSMHGGFVEWRCGSGDDDGSVAVQLYPRGHWPALRVFILVASSRRKSVASTAGMRRSVATSTLLRHRVDTVVPARLASAKRAIASRDFAGFADIAMRESNQLHAICADTFPPLRYLDPASDAVIEFVHRFNSARGDVRLAYTFDAGPNAFLFTLAEHVADVASVLCAVFGDGSDDFMRGMRCKSSFTPLGDENEFERLPGMVEYMICTDVGGGPQLVAQS